MAWQDYLTDDERRELAEAEAVLADAMARIQPVRIQRDKVRRKLKVRCDARMRRDDGGVY
jgi:hypothetical protein